MHEISEHNMLDYSSNSVDFCEKQRLRKQKYRESWLTRVCSLPSAPNWLHCALNCVFHSYISTSSTLLSSCLSQNTAILLYYLSLGNCPFWGSYKFVFLKVMIFWVILFVYISDAEQWAGQQWKVPDRDLHL